MDTIYHSFLDCIPKTPMSLLYEYSLVILRVTFERMVLTTQDIASCLSPSSQLARCGGRASLYNLTLATTDPTHQQQQQTQHWPQLQNVFLSIDNCICFKFEKVFVSNYIMNYSQIARCICLMFPNVFMSQITKYIYWSHMAD